MANNIQLKLLLGWVCLCSLSSMCIAIANIEADTDGITIDGEGDVKLIGTSLQFNGIDIGQALSKLQAQVEKLDTDHTTQIQNVINSMTRMNTSLNTKITNTNQSTEIKKAIDSITMVNKSIIARLDREQEEKDEEHERSENSTFYIFDSIDSRLNELEEVVYADLDWANLIGEGDFEDDNGNPVNSSRFSLVSSPVCGEGYRIVNVAEDPPPGSRASNHSLQMGPGLDSNCQMDYEIRYRTKYDGRHLKMCPGPYRFRAWVKVSSDYDGVPMVFHHRFFNPDGRVIQIWNLQNEEAAIEAGAWPRFRDTWMMCEFATTLKDVAEMMVLYVGYPFRSSKGTVMVTNVEVSKLGGGVSSC